MSVKERPVHFVVQQFSPTCTTNMSLVSICFQIDCMKAPRKGRRPVWTSNSTGQPDRAPHTRTKRSESILHWVRTHTSDAIGYQYRSSPQAESVGLEYVSTIGLGARPPNSRGDNHVTQQLGPTRIKEPYSLKDAMPYAQIIWHAGQTNS